MLSLSFYFRILFFILAWGIAFIGFAKASDSSISPLVVYCAVSLAGFLFAVVELLGELIVLVHTESEQNS